MRRIIVVLAALLALFCTGEAPATTFEQRAFADQAQERRYRALVAELRCLVCQNQSLAESEAELAADLREQVYTMIRNGDDDRRIVEYMTARYGDFVLYRPPLKATTVALWAGPAVLAAGGIFFLIAQVRKKRQTPASAQLTETERTRLAALLDSGERTE